MKHHLTYKDDKSDKFWQIETAENSYTVTFGKANTNGSSKTTNFDSEAECMKEANKLVSEKLKKGYTEKTQPHANYADDWKKLTASTDLSDALIQHFSYLADTPEFASTLKSIMKKATSVAVVNDMLQVQFEDGSSLIASKPATTLKPEYPRTFTDITRHHELIIFKDQIILGDHGNFDFRWLEDFESELLEITDADTILSPIWFYSDCWLYHPIEKNDSGEPKIYFLSHEGPDISTPQLYNAGSLFLTLIAEGLKIAVTPHKNNSTTITTVELKPLISPNLREISLRKNLINGDLIELCQSRLTILRYNKGTFDVLSEISDIPLTSGASIQESPDGIFVYLNNLGYCLFELPESKLTLVNRIVFDSRWDGVFYHDEDLYYYQSYAPKGFHRRSFLNDQPSVIFRRNEPHKHFFIQDSEMFGDVILFASQNALIGFKVTDKNTLPVEAFNIKSVFGAPRLLKITNNCFLVFDMCEDGTALTLYELNKNAKRLQKLREGETAMAWQFTDNNLWLLTKNKDTQYSFSRYSWNGRELILVSQTAITFVYDGEEHLRRVEHLFIRGNEVVFINWDRTFWVMPLLS